MSWIFSLSVDHPWEELFSGEKTTSGRVIPESWNNIPGHTVLVKPANVSKEILGESLMSGNDAIQPIIGLVF